MGTRCRCLLSRDWHPLPHRFVCSSQNRSFSPASKERAWFRICSTEYRFSEFSYLEELPYLWDNSLPALRNCPALWFWPRQLIHYGSFLFNFGLCSVAPTNFKYNPRRNLWLECVARGSNISLLNLCSVRDTVEIGVVASASKQASLSGLNSGQTRIEPWQAFPINATLSWGRSLRNVRSTEYFLPA